MDSIKDLTDRLEIDLGGPRRAEIIKKLRSDLISVEAEIRTQLAGGVPKVEFDKLNSIYAAVRTSLKTLDILRAV